MKRLNKLAVLLAIVPALVFAGPVFADSPGQLQGGPATYEVKNVTQKGAYANTISASACEELGYSIELHNTEFGLLSNIVVGVNLPSNSATTNTSTMTATTAAGGTSGTTGTTTVNLSSAQSISYINGTAQLFDENGNLIKMLPDTITQSGVNVGNLNGSTTEFVNFKAKVNCPPTPTPTPTPTPSAPVVTTASSTKAIPNTGPGDVAGLFVGTSVLGGAGHYLVARRRR